MTDLYARVSDERLVNTTKPGNQTEPKMAALEGGGYVVVWTDQNVTGNYESRGQVFDASGNAVGGEFLINSSASGNQFNPRVAALDGGGFVVSFTDSIGDGAANTGVRVQMFDATGVKVGSELTANQTTAGNQLLSSIVGLPGGGFLATWQEGSATSGDVRARFFDASGAPTGNEFTVNTAATNTQRDGWVAVLSSGNIVISWQDAGGADGSGIGVRAQMYTAAGVAVGGEFGINTVTSGAQGNHSITALKDGGFVVTWEDHSQDSNNAVVTEIRAQVFDNSGAKVGGEIAVNGYTLLSQITPSVAALDSGGFVIVWDDASGSLGETQDGGSHGIHAQVFNADGTKDGADFLVNTTIPQNQWLPTVAGLSGGGFAVAWVDASGLHDNTGYGIVSQVFEISDGSISDIALSDATVIETQAENTIIGTLTADGPVNEDRDLVYTIVADSTSGAFGIKDDKLIVADNAKLDFETAPSATVTVKVTDKDGNSYQEALTISVTDAVSEVRYHAGNDVPVNTTTNANQNTQAMAALSGGGYVITWTDSSLTGGDTTGSAIRAQLFDDDGNKVGSEFLVNTSTAANQAGSAVTGTVDGGFLAVWQDAGTAPGVIRGQFFDSAGAKVGTEFQVDDGAGGSSLPVVTLLNSGNFLVSWQDTTGDAGTSTNGTTGVRGQLISAAGAKVGGEFTLNTQITQAQESPAIATTATGFVASWVDRNSTGLIRAQFFDNDGNRVGAELQVNTNAANNQLQPTATVLANGDVLFTWWDLSLVGGDNSNGGIKGRLYNSSGTALTGEFLVNTTINFDQTAPKVTALPGGGFIVVFEDRSEYMLGNIRAQQFDGSGTKVGEEFVATWSTSYAQKVPTIALLANGDWAIAWQAGTNFGFDPLGWDIHTRVFHAALSGTDPVANPDSLTAETGIAETFAAADLLGNDTHAFGTLAIVAVSSGAGGTAVLNPDGSVTFTSTPAFLGTATFSYTISDGEGGTATATASVDVTGPNTPPTEAANAGATVAEGGTIAITAAMLDYDDAEQADTAIVYVVTSVATNGVLQLSGSTLGLNDTFTQDDIANGRVTYVHDGSETTGAAFGFSVADGRGGTVAGQSFAIAVTPVNDTPVEGLPSTVFTAEDTPAPLNGGVAIDPPPSWISDADSATVTATLSVSDGALSVTGSGTAVVTGNGSNSVTVSGLVADVNLSVYYASYAPAPDVYGSRAITVAISDGNSSESGTITVNISPTRDTPEGADLTLTATEDTPYNLHALDFGFSDVDGDSLASVILTSTPIHGRIVDLGGYIESTDITGDGVPDVFLTVPQHDLVAGEVLDLSLMAMGYIVYIPASNAFGAAADSFTYQVVDNGAVPFTAGTVDPTPNTITFDIGGVNDVPTLTDLETAISLSESDTPTIIDADVSLSDPEGNYDGGSLTVTGALSEDLVLIRDVGTDPGEIGLDGADVTYGGIVIGTLALAPGGSGGLDLTVTFNGNATSAAIEALVENLTYLNTSDDPSAARDLTIAVTDNLAETSSQTVTVNVAAVNDAPVNTVPADGAITGYASAPIAITGIQVDDVDADPSATITVTIGTASGTLHVAAGVVGGGSVSGNDSASVVLSGTLDQVNTTLASLNGVTLTAGVGSVDVTVTTSDGGSNGADPGLSGGASFEEDSDTFSVEVLNHDPIVSITTAYPPAGGETQVNTFFTGQQVQPAIAALAGGGYVVTWTSANQDGVSNGVYSQRYDNAGNALGSETRVNTMTLGGQAQPSVAALESGGYVVTWVSENQDGGGYGIFAQRYDAAGNPAGSETQINTTVALDQLWPSVAALAGGGFVVTWQSSQQDGSGFGIYARSFDDAGGALTGEVLVNTFTTNHQLYPAVAALTDGGYVVTWQSEIQDSGSVGVYAQRYDSAGDPVGGETQVNTTSADGQDDPSVAGLTDGGYVVTWQSGNQDGSGGSIYAQRYDSDGNPVGGETQVNTTTVSDQTLPSVTALADGGYVVTWTSFGQEGGPDRGVYAQRYDSNGDPVGGETHVNTVTAGEQNSSVVAGLTDGGYVIAWESSMQDGSQTGIFAQRFADPFAAVEQVPLDLKGTISVDDGDGAGVTVTVTLSVDYGVLAISAGTSGAVATEIFPNEWELTGTIAQINALLDTDGTSTVTYTYDNDYAPPSDTLTVSVDDGISSDGETAEITITAVNDAPEVDLDFFEPGTDAALTWTEGDGPQLLAPMAVFDDDNDSHDGATLTVTINGATSGDQLTIDNMGTGLGELGVSGSNVTYEGEIVGTWSGGVDGAPLVITFNADACYCSIELAMASILYDNSDNLTAATSRIVDFTFVDGGDTANGGDDTTTASVDLTVLPFAEVVAGPDATGNEDLPIALTGVVIDGVANDPASDVITVTLGVANGTLDVRTDVVGGLAAGDVAGNGTDTLVLNGTQDAINATLAAANGLTYQGDPEFSGSDALSIEARGEPLAGTLDFTPLLELDVSLPVEQLDMYDFDGDGTSDLVVGLEDEVIVFGSVVLGLGLPDPGFPVGFAFDNFDGDGFVDIAVAVAGDTDGYLAIISTEATDIVKIADGITYAADIASGDFNGDSLADIAISDSYNSRVAIILQSAPGVFAPVTYTTPTTSIAASLAVGDFNGDNILDMLVSNPLEVGMAPPGSVDLLLGNGDGTFDAAVEVLATPGRPQEIVVADFNGDGALDFAFASISSGGFGTNGAVVVLGNGDGTFAAPVGYDTTPDGEPYELVAADFDGDGVLDLAVANLNDPPSFSVLLGNGDGSFAAPLEFDAIDPPFVIGAGDPDDDGDIDIVVGSIEGYIDGFNNDVVPGRSANATKDIVVNAVNDAPTSTNLAGDSVTWIEGNAPVLLDNGGDATLGDVDSTDFDGGSLTLAITGGDPAQDVLAVVNQGTGVGQIGVSGANVSYGGVTIGTVAGGSAGAPLVVSFNASATTQAIEALARAVTYANAGGGDPTPGTRTVGWTLVDGDGTANGGVDTLALTTSVVVVSGEPVLDLNGADPGTSSSLSYNEGDPLLAIAPSATLTDPNAIDYAGGVLTVAITANGHPDDRLALVGPGFGGGTFMVDEVDLYYDFGAGPQLIGSIIGGTGGSPLVITFNATATPAVVEALVRSVGFNNFWMSPGNLQREVTFTLSDGDGDTSAPVVATIDVTGTPDAPVAVDDVFSLVENEVKVGSLFADNGYGNDFNPEGGPMQVIEVNGTAALVGSTITLASGALLKVNANGSFTYDPNGAFNALVPAESGAANTQVSDSFTYTITGGASATVNITQAGVVSVGDIYKGDGGGNGIVGTANIDYFDVSQGGDDYVAGMGGNDAFYFGAALTAADTVDGGAGTNDQIGLEGDYSAGLTLGAGTIANIEVIAMLAGFDYSITTHDGNVPNGGSLSVFAGNLGPGDNFTFNGSAELDGRFMVYCGMGTDIVTTGAGDDGIYFGPGKFDPTVDRVNGGTGANDQFALDGDYTGLTLDGVAIQNIDVITLLKGIPSDLAQYDLTLADSLIGAGQTMTIWGSQLETALAVDSSGETDGNIKMFGGTLGDTLAGGAGNDWFWGGLGGDMLTGGAGGDTFYYETVAQSSAAAYDTLVEFDDTVDKIDLDGVTVASFASAVSSALDAATIGTQLASAASALGAGQAMVFTANAGDLSGSTFLLIDANSTSGYQAGGDFLIALASPVGPIDNVGMFV